MLELMRLVHFIGIAWGVGGVTVNGILMLKAEKNPELAPHIMKVMPAIGKLVWAAIIIMVISGIILAPLTPWPIDKTLLAAKHVVVVLLILSGLNINFRALPKMEKLAPLAGAAPSEEFLKAKRNVKISGIVGMILWYAVMVLSVYL